MMYQLYKWIILLLLIPKMFYCQNEKYIIKKYDADNNQLPQNSVKSVVADNYGFIWITTENGLVRFDGENFITYRFNKVNVSDRMTIINTSKQELYTFSDSKNDIMIIENTTAKTFDKNNYHNSKKLFDQYKQTIFRNNNDTTGIYFSQVFETKNDLVYILNKNYISCNKKGRIKSKFPNLHKNFFRYFLFDNELFYLKNLGLLNKYNDKGISNIVTEGLDKLKKYKYYTNIPNNQLFIIQNNKLYILSKKLNKLYYKILFECKNINDFAIKSIYYDDKNEILYLGSLTNGLYTIRKNHFKVLNKKGALNNVYYGITEIDNNIASAKGYIFNEDNNLVHDFSDKLLQKDYLEDQYGIIFNKEFGTYVKQTFSLINLNNTFRKKRIVFKSDLPIYKIAQGLDNKIWISLSDKNREKNTFGYINSKNESDVKIYSIKNLTVNCLFQLNHNLLFIGTVKGAYIFNITTEKYTSILENFNIENISKTKDLIWITSYGKGIFIFYKNKIYKLPLNNDTLLTSHAIIEDNHGFYWISSNNGLFQMSRNNLLDYFSNFKTKIYCYRYSKRDGILSNEFNGSCTSAALKLPNGKLAFSSLNGILIADVDNLKPIISKEFYMCRASLDGKDFIYQKDSINIDKKFQRLILKIDLPNQGDLKNNYFEYSFDNENWINITSKQIEINKLDPYYNNIYVRMQIPFTGKFIYKNILIYRSPKFIETFFFRFLVIILFLICFFLIHKWRIKFIKKINDKLNYRIEQYSVSQKEIINSLMKTSEDLDDQVENQSKLIQFVTHDIKSPLKFIVSSTNFLVQNYKDKDDTDDIKETVLAINDSLLKLYSFINDLSSYSQIISQKHFKRNVNNIVVYKLIEKKKSLFEKIAHSKKVKIINNIEPNFKLKTNAVFLEIVIHNLLDNSIKNTSNGKIIISNKESSILFTDSGQGMKSDKIEELLAGLGRGTGYKLIITLLDLMDAKLNINSKIGYGTTVEILFDTIP